MPQEFYLILPNIRSAHNVGAMFRTADACGVDQIFLVGYTPIPPRPDIAKVALGAETWMKWKQYKNLKTLIKNLQKKGDITAVWQNGGFSAKFNSSSSIELLYKTEHFRFEFRHFAKL